MAFNDLPNIKKVKYLFQSVTIEPVFFLFAMNFGFFAVASQQLYVDKMFGLDDHLWSIDIHGDKEKKMVSNIHDFDICNSHIWVSERNKARIIQLNTNFEMDYDYLDGIPGNKIFGIECDEEWVWFLTNDGVAFYKWGNYHQEN